MVTEAQERRAAAKRRESAAAELDERGLIALEQQQLHGSTPVEDTGETGEISSGVTVKNDGYAVLYKKVSYGWKRTVVVAGSVEACLQSGAFRLVCGDCGGMCGLDPNDCPAREPLAFRRCPDCGKRIFDTGEEQQAERGEAAPGEIVDDAYQNTTPEQRTKVKLDNHIAAFHPSRAQSMGLVSVQTAQVTPMVATAVVQQAPVQAGA